jgi:hypothetical protein
LIIVFNRLQKSNKIVWGQVVQEVQKSGKNVRFVFGVDPGKGLEFVWIW